MSTLNLPAIIARLHNASDQYGKRGISTKRDATLTNGYKHFKLPEIVRHVGIGDRGWMNLQNNNSLWNQTLYLDHVLRRNQSVELNEAAATFTKYGHRNPPRLLPKLANRPIENEHTAAPFVKGRNAENRFCAVQRLDVRDNRAADEDEDAEWTRNALDGATSREIVRAYEHKNTLISTANSVLATNGNVPKQVIHTNEKPLPPIQQTESDNQNDESSKMQRSVTGDINEKTVPKFVLHSFDFEEQLIEKRDRMLARSSLFVPTLEQKSKQQTNTSHDLSPNLQKQSTFSRIMNPDPHPKTQAGKKLLSSLLGRADVNRRNALKKQNPAAVQKPTAIFYSEEYLRHVQREEHLKNDKLLNKISEPSNVNKKFGVGASFDKLPADLVGHHFQQTYEHLWKYLVNNGKRNIPKSYFASKEELQKSNPSVIYIPTGRPEEALYVEGMERKTVSLTERNNEPIKLKYNHRSSDNQTVSRSKDTSPWTIEDQLRTPENVSKPVGVKYLPEFQESHKNTIQFDSETFSQWYNDDSIRKVSIKLPLTETRAPPCTPDSLNFDTHVNKIMQETDYVHDNFEDNPPEFGAKAIRQPKHQPVYPTRRKNVKFKAMDKTSEHDRKSEKNKSKKGKGPVPARNTNVDHDPNNETKKTRVYSHGQYHIKVDEKIVHRRKPKLPKDMSNMFTKPYTFSYLTGVKAPSTLSSTLFSGKIANLSSIDKFQTMHHSTLVSEIHQPFQDMNNTDEINISTTKNAYPQFFVGPEDPSMSKSPCPFRGNETPIVEQSTIIEPKLPTKNSFELRLSSTKLRDEERVKESPRPRKTSPKKTLYQKKHVRSLSEGAKSAELKSHRTTVQTYDASKYFRSTDEKN